MRDKIRIQIHITWGTEAFAGIIRNSFGRHWKRSIDDALIGTRVVEEEVDKMEEEEVDGDEEEEEVSLLITLFAAARALDFASSSLYVC